MKTKEEILNKKFKESGIKKGWIDESKKAVLDAMEEYAKQKESYKNNWVDAKKEQPLLIENQNYSSNVLAICNGQLMVMCYCYNPSEDDSERGFFWANCYGRIDGDAEFDDEYDVTFWQYFPSIEGFVV